MYKTLPHRWREARKRRDREQCLTIVVRDIIRREMNKERAIASS